MFGLLAEDTKVVLFADVRLSPIADIAEIVDRPPFVVMDNKMVDK